MTTRRTEYATGERSPGLRARDGFLVPGGVVGDGRYRLLAQLGADERASAQLWRARDGQLRRDVALTVLLGEVGDAAATHAARRTLERATHAARLTHPGMARVLDVLNVGNGLSASEGLLGVVVADWAQGTDLIDVVAEHPLPPATAARLLAPLAAAVEHAHHSGLVLGVDHPQRIRVTPEGLLRLAFPGPLADATLHDDVRGLGAILYLLLTGKWPLPGGPAGIPTAPAGPDGTVLAPGALHQHVPAALSDVTLRSLADTAIGGIRTSATLIGVLDRVVETEERTDRIRPAGAPPPDDADDGVWTTRPPVRDRARRRKLAIGVTLLAVATVAVLAWLGMLLISFVGDDGSGAGGPQVELTQDGSGSEDGGQPAKPVPVQPAEVHIFALEGDDTDNSEDADNLVDKNRGTTWATDQYENQFPSFREGIGIMCSFAEAIKLTSVSLNSVNEGTVVEIRSAPSVNPLLDETTVLGSATLGERRTQIPLSDAEPTQYVLIWISQLGSGNQSEIAELGFTRAR